MYLWGVIYNGTGKEDRQLLIPPSLMDHSLVAEGHLSSAVSGSQHGFSSLLVLEQEGTLNTINQSAHVSDPSTNCLQVPRS